jgi:cytosine/adenosine deaminase-related metal-dependent hydrolase
VRTLVAAANGAVGIEGDRLVEPTGTFDVVLQVRDGTLHPGLINAHDHLHRNHYGRLGAPPYANAYEWGRDIHRRHAASIAGGRACPRRAALLHGAWKNLRAGVTTVVHHDAWEPDFDVDFPLRVARVACAHSLGCGGELPASPPGAPFAIHLAEGVDEESAAEVRELAARGRVNRDLLAVHAVGADHDGIVRLRAARAAVVWCPSSNLFLFGRTAPAALLAPGIDVLLGSDSLLTANGSLLDELRVARSLGVLDDQRLRDAVGRTAARRLGVDAPSLDVGARADVVVMRRPVIGASEADVALVVAGGVVRVLEPALVPALGSTAACGRLVRSRGVVRWVADQPRERARRAALATATSSRAVRS